jgi:hypothetical protein
MSESIRRFDLIVLPDSLVIVRLSPDAALPPWATQGAFFSVTRTGEELSIVCVARQIPPGVAAEAGWRALKVAGRFALSEVGVLASLAAPLAKASISLFVISTFDTDYLLISEKQLPAAVAALREAGHHIKESSAAA